MHDALRYSAHLPSLHAETGSSVILTKAFFHVNYNFFLTVKSLTAKVAYPDWLIVYHFYTIQLAVILNVTDIVKIFFFCNSFIISRTNMGVFGNHVF